MRTLLLEIDESIYKEVMGFLQLLPEKKCHIIESQPPTAANQEALTIASAFGLIKTSRTASLEEIEQGIISGAIDDRD